MLTLSRMDGLEEWMVPGGEVVAVFPCLEELSIKDCGKLKSIPICCLSSLVEFKIDSCNELRYLSFVSSSFKYMELSKAGIHSKRTTLHSSGGIGYYLVR